MSQVEINNILNIDCVERVKKINKNLKKDYIIKSMKMYLGYKVHIVSPLLCHTLELYQVNNLIKSVTMHHFGQVRAFFDGETILGPISFYSTCLTFRSPDIRWHSSHSIKEETEAKWIHRGFGIFLNLKEKVKFVEHIRNSKFWADLFGISKNLKSFRKLADVQLSPVNLDSLVYRPLVYKQDYYTSLVFPVDLSDPYNEDYSKNFKIVKNKMDSKNYINKYSKKKNLEIKFEFWRRDGNMEKIPLSLINYILDTF